MAKHILKLTEKEKSYLLALKYLPNSIKAEIVGSRKLLGLYKKLRWNLNVDGDTRENEKLFSSSLFRE